MAVKRQVIETRISDLSGEESESVTTLKFTINGKVYKLDVTPAEMAEFDGAIAKYTSAADEAKSGTGVASGDDDSTIRQWGRDHGWDVNERGRVAASLKAAYYKAMSEPRNEGTNNGGNDDSATPEKKAPTTSKK